MRRVIAVLCASLLAVGLMAGPAAARGPDDPFTGAWVGLEGTLPITVAFGGNGPVRHVSIADFCNACQPSGYMSIAIGWGVIDGDTLTAEVLYHDGGWSDYGPGWADPMEVTFTLQPDGTLAVFGTYLHRPGS